MARGIILAQGISQAQSDAGQSHEVARGLVNLYKLVRPHDERSAGRRRPGAGVETQHLCPACPTQQRQIMLPAIAPSRSKDNLLMMAVATGERLAIDEDQRLRMRKIPGNAQGQKKGNRLIARPRGRDHKCRSQQKIQVGFTPHHPG